MSTVKTLSGALCLLLVGAFGSIISLAADQDLDSISFEVSATANHRVTVEAEDAPLEAVIEAIGAQLQVSVESSIPNDARITVQFEDLPLQEALERLSDNYVYITDEAGGRITKIILLPQGEDAPAAVSGPEEVAGQDPSSADGEGRADAPQPFRFEFDPAAVVQTQ